MQGQRLWRCRLPAQLSQANTDLYGQHGTVQNKGVQKGQMCQEKRKIKKLDEPVWKTQSLYRGGIWIRIVPLDAMMGSRSTHTAPQTLSAPLG